MTELAVFPLPIVVFPGMTVPLHVFEERYKRLVRHASAQTPARFLIAPPPGEALDAEGAGRPGAVGTRVDVLDVTENADGTFTLLGHGRERCRLGAVREERVDEPGGAERPLWFATTEDWPLERGDPNEEQVAAWDALEAFRRYADVFFAPDARRQADEALPKDPLYQASFVCANLRLPPGGAQRLLEAPSLVARFAAAKEAIEARLAARASGDAEEGPDAPRHDLAGELGEDLDDEAFAQALESDLAALFGEVSWDEDDDPDEADDEDDEDEDGIGSA